MITRLNLGSVMRVSTTPRTNKINLTLASSGENSPDTTSIGYRVNLVILTVLNCEASEHSYDVPRTGVDLCRFESPLAISLSALRIPKRERITDNVDATRNRSTTHTENAPLVSPIVVIRNVPMPQGARPKPTGSRKVLRTRTIT